MAKDYYKILGVSRDADQATIKRAFRELAKKYHPDRNKSQAAKDKFQRIKEAYEVLKNPEKRQRYDISKDEKVSTDNLAAQLERIRQVLIRQKTRKRKKTARMKEQEKNLFRYAMKVLFIPAIIVIAVIVGFSIYSSYQNEQYLKEQGVVTRGRISAVHTGVIGPAYAEYIYIAKNKQYKSSIQLPLRMDTNPINKNGMPIRPGDEFMVIYDPKQPEKSQLYMTRPTKEQLMRYHHMAKDKCITKRKDEIELSSLVQYCDCLMSFIYTHYGINGYADVYFQDENPLRYGSHNRNTYQKLTQKEKYKEGVQVCRERYLP